MRPRSVWSSRNHGASPSAPTSACAPRPTLCVGAGRIYGRLATSTARVVSLCAPRAPSPTRRRSPSTVKGHGGPMPSSTRCASSKRSCGRTTPVERRTPSMWTSSKAGLPTPRPMTMPMPAATTVRRLCGAAAARASCAFAQRIVGRRGVLAMPKATCIITRGRPSSARRSIARQRTTTGWTRTEHSPPCTLRRCGCSWPRASSHAMSSARWSRRWIPWRTARRWRAPNSSRARGATRRSRPSCSRLPPRPSRRRGSHRSSTRAVASARRVQASVTSSTWAQPRAVLHRRRLRRLATRSSWWSRTPTRFIISSSVPCAPATRARSSGCRHGTSPRARTVRVPSASRAPCWRNSGARYGRRLRPSACTTPPQTSASSCSPSALRGRRDGRRRS
mmetsp:Transcript_474/g.1361  ORF Transcript_474/g.1361 Transcript_474/m.1361 type:complete len:392 (-) Transcript_474:559-1734(-)